jgi:hypothetical protein
MKDQDQIRLDARARRTMKRCELVVRKSRSRKNSTFKLVDPTNRGLVAGSQFELTGRDVIEACNTDGGEIMGSSTGTTTTAPPKDISREKVPRGR